MMNCVKFVIHLREPWQIQGKPAHLQIVVIIEILRVCRLRIRLDAEDKHLALT